MSTEPRSASSSDEDEDEALLDTADITSMMRSALSQVGEAVVDARDAVDDVMDDAAAQAAEGAAAAAQVVRTATEEGDEDEEGDEEALDMVSAPQELAADSVVTALGWWRHFDLDTTVDQLQSSGLQIAERMEASNTQRAILASETKVRSCPPL